MRQWSLLPKHMFKSFGKERYARGVGSVSDFNGAQKQTSRRSMSPWVTMTSSRMRAQCVPNGHRGLWRSTGHVRTDLVRKEYCDAVKL